MFEILSLLQPQNPLQFQRLLDIGTHASLLDAGNFVRTLTERQGLQVGSPDEIAYEFKWITKEGIMRRAEKFEKNHYGLYLEQL